MAPALSQTCAIPGYFGPATLSGTSEYVNTYHAGTGSPAAGATSITVASIAGQRSNTSDLLPGSMILIMQMQDSVTPANAGLHEYAQVASIGGTTLNLTRPLANSYSRNVSTGNVRTWQVVQVPQYSSLTISGTVRSNSWFINPATGDGTGGVVALDVAGSLAINGTISVAGLGFRGAAGQSGKGSRAGGTYTDAQYTAATTFNNINGGMKGEGTGGTPLLVFHGFNASIYDYSALIGQGYAAGAAGRGAIGNAGGGGNDGNPPFGTSGSTGNQFNSGGGGGAGGGGGGRGGNAWNNNSSGGILNQPAGGNTGNESGGLGGSSNVYSATRLILGGGGGSGGSNDGTTSIISTWPPAETSTAANGAQGAVTSSGASGGGIVAIRAGQLSATAGVIDASGVRAYNKSLNPPSDADSGGGGGGGGAVSIRALSGSATGLTIRATGGAGGSANHYNHGPGGGGGGGYVVINVPGASINVGGGANGTDGCCGGATGNGSPKAYNSTPGSAGVSSLVADGTPSGVEAGASCLPSVTVSKSTLTPNISLATGATASYRVNVSNSGGAATNLFLFDSALPPGWTLLASPAPTYTYSPAPTDANSAGAELTSATLPAGAPVSNASTVNGTGSVALRAGGAAPGVVPTAGSGSLTFGSFHLPQNASITVSFAVSIPDTASVGTYHNGAGVAYLDPTRTAPGALRMIGPATNASANRSGIAHVANTTHQTGATAAVAGMHHSALVAGPSTDDVSLQPDLSVSKLAGTASFQAGGTSFYVITPRNNGRAIGTQVFALTQAADQAASSFLPSVFSVTDTMPAGLTLNAVTNSNPGVWTCAPSTGSASFTCTAGTGLLPMAAATDLVTITATTRISQAACPGPVINAVSIGQAAVAESSTTNNTATASTPLGCAASLTVSKTNGVNSVTAGGTTSYTVTFSNQGPASADGAVVSDQSGTGLSCTVGSCMANGGASCPAPAQWPDLLSGSVVLSSFPSSSSTTFLVDCVVTATGR